MRLSVNVNLISNTVGQGWALRQRKDKSEKWKEVGVCTEWKLYPTMKGGGLLPPLNHNKSTDINNYIFILYRRGELCSPVFNLLWIDGRPQVAPTGCANILISYQPKLIIYQQQFNGGSKPPPYNTIWYKFTFTDNRIFSLPCVKGGAERTWGGGIVRLILYEFIKSLSHFLFQKNDSSLYKGACVGQGQALSLRDDIEFNFDSSR